MRPSSGRLIMYPQPTHPAPPPDVVIADLVRDAAEFDHLIGEWDELVASSGSQTPFLKGGWLDCWRRYASRGVALNVITVRERGQLVAAVPLMRVRRSFADRLEFLG